MLFPLVDPTLWELGQFIVVFTLNFTLHTHYSIACPPLNDILNWSH